MDKDQLLRQLASIDQTVNSIRRMLLEERRTAETGTALEPERITRLRDFLQAQIVPGRSGKPDTQLRAFTQITVWLFNSLGHAYAAREVGQVLAELGFVKRAVREDGKVVRKYLVAPKIKTDENR